MTRHFAFSLTAAVVLLTQAAAVAAQPAMFVTAGRPQSSNRSSSSLPNTSRLDGELRSTQNALDALIAKLHRTEKSVESARKAAQNVQYMIKALAKLEGKISRIKREVDSLVRIPQLRLLKPLSKALANVQTQVHKLRVKAEEADRKYVKPMISRLKSVEGKLETKLSQLRGVAAQTRQARSKLAQLRSFVEGRGNRRSEARALESIARGVQQTIRPVSQMVSNLDRSLGNVDRDFAALASTLNGVSRAKSSVTKLDRDLAKADDVARKLSKVMNKRISIKFPVKVSVSVRQILESPGKVIDIAVKPLQALAQKILKPVLPKKSLTIKLPRELSALSGKLNGLSSALSRLQSPISKIDQALRTDVPKNFQTQINRLANTSTSQLGR
ncbi:MAG: hypothetical protein DWQ37_05690 [Planctomycetota bacterium]|nr:MAG: hypothetical protein DWQ37_05690 [Planctomycetota bacterium]